MADVISPPVRVLDFGYQSPNPLDYARMAQMQTQPMQEAVNNAMESRNRFLMSQLQFQHEKELNNLNAQKAFQLAQWQHQAQIERERMRDDRMLEVRRMANQAAIDAAKQRGVNAVILQKLNEANSWGAKIPEGDPTDKGYLNKLSSAINQRQDEVKNTVATNLASINLRRQALTAANSSPEAQDLQAKAQAFAGSPNNMELAKQEAGTKFRTQYPELSDQVTALTQNNPGMNPGEALNKVPGAAQAFAGLFRAEQGAIGDKWLLGNGGKTGMQVAQFNAASRALDNEEQGVSTFTVNGRRVVWPNLPDARALANDPNWVRSQPSFNAYFKAVDAKPPQPATQPALPPAVPSRNPVTVSPMPGYDSNGNAINAAPLAETARTLRDASYFLPREGGPDFKGWTEQDKAMAAAANPGFWSGMIHAPGYWTRQVGSLFDSSINPSDAFPAGNAHYSPIMLPPRASNVPAVAPMQAPVVLPSTNAPVIDPTSLLPRAQPLGMPNPVMYPAAMAALQANQAGVDTQAQTLGLDADQMANYDNMRFLYNQ